MNDSHSMITAKVQDHIGKRLREVAYEEPAAKRQKATDGATAEKRLLEAKSLVCARCWTNFFDTIEYQDLCVGSSKNLAGDKVIYETSRAYYESFSNVCSWCRLIENFIKRLQPLSDGRRLPPVRPNEQLRIELTTSDSKIGPPGRVNCFQISTIRRSRSRGCSLLAFTAVENKTAAYVTARPPRRDIFADNIKNDISHWIEDCLTHDCCAKPIEVALPSRLIDLNPTNDPEHVRLTASRGCKGTYATLSYCWGKAPSPTLTSVSLTAFFEGIPWDILPKTIKDAILVARATGMQYLWIDAFCIIQDDKEDKNREIAKMCDIYRDSTITIVAASSEAASQGFLHTRVCSYDTFAVPFRIEKGNFCTMSLQFPRDIEEERKNEPIQERAWTFQEQLLAQRILYFSSRTLEWRCAAGRRFLEPNTPMPAMPLSAENSLEGSLLSRMQMPFSEDPDEVLDFWLNLVRNYSPRKVSYDADRLLALAGLAEHFSSALGPAYYAGIWRHNIKKQLSWIRPKSAQAITTRSKEYCAPSWSWVSCCGPISFVPADSTIKIIEIDRTLVSSTIPYGAVTHAEIKVSGVCAYGLLIPPDPAAIPGEWTVAIHDGNSRIEAFDGVEAMLDWKSSRNTPSQWHYITAEFDAVEEMKAQDVMCLQMTANPNRWPNWGLVLRGVDGQAGVYRRIGVYSDGSEHSMEWWCEKGITII